MEHGEQWLLDGSMQPQLTPVRTRPPSSQSTTALDGLTQPAPTDQPRSATKRSGSKKQRRRRSGALATTSMPVTPSARLSEEASPSAASGASGASTSYEEPTAFSTPPHHQQQQQQHMLSPCMSAGAAERLIARRASEHNTSATTSMPHTSHTPHTSSPPLPATHSAGPHTVPRAAAAAMRHTVGGGDDDSSHDMLASPFAPSSSNDTPLSHHSFSHFTNGRTPPPLATVLEAARTTPQPPTPQAPTPQADRMQGAASSSGQSDSGSRRRAAFAGFIEHLRAEAHPVEKFPTADVVWRQTERDRVYNFLLYVPYQMERVMWMGTFVCLTSFLAVLTTLPLRCLRALTHIIRPAPSPKPGSRRGPLAGHQLYDLICAGLLVAAVVCLRLLQPGLIYYWMKDITSEFLKIQVLFTALEILDKIFANFGVDVLEALSSTCTLFVHKRTGAAQLCADTFVAFLLVTMHGAVLMCEAMVFAVAMNSKRHALMALLIASNFVELKGNVYKRTDTNKLWSLACMDIVERFHLLVVLAFVVVEDVCNSGGGWLPQHATLSECGRIFAWEVVIDITKHAVLGKFNDIRPGIYREYMRDLCEDIVDRQSNTLHKLMGFCPMGPAALALRMLTTLVWMRGDQQANLALRCCGVLAVWLLACVVQAVLGYVLKRAAQSYVEYRSSQAGGNVRRSR